MDDSRLQLELYLSDTDGRVFEEDFLIFPIESLTEIFKDGKFKGDVLIELKYRNDFAGRSDQLQVQEKKEKSAAQPVPRCDLKKENIRDPVTLSPLNCIISVFLLDDICKDQDDFIKYLKKSSEMLNPGGHLILIGCLDVEKDKILSFKYEEFVRKSMGGEGFVIDSWVTKKATKVVMFITAHKEKSV